MPTTTSSSAYPTGTLEALPALTTPFDPPPSCPTVTVTTSIITTQDWGVTTTYEAKISDPADPDYTSCQPSQWQPQHSYSPGVCPSGWVAADMATTKVGQKTLSTAHCCKSGYGLMNDYHRLIPGVGRVCMDTYDISTTTTTSTNTRTNWKTELVTETYTFRPTITGWTLHPAWFIAWEQKDLDTMTPRPPDLTSSMRIPQWTAGQTMTPGQYDNGGSGPPTRQDGWGGGGSLSLFWFVVIGLPLIVSVLVIGCCVACCCCGGSKEGKARRRFGVPGSSPAVTTVPGNNHSDVSLSRVDVSAGKGSGAGAAVPVRSVAV